MRQTGMQLAKRLLARAGLQVQVFRSQEFIPIPLWEQDGAFLRLWREVEHHTVVDRRRCYLLYQYARQVRSLDGDAAEVGVYRGGTARLIARLLVSPSRTVHLFDTFSGMPATDPLKDRHQAGDFHETSLAAVTAYLADCAPVAIHPGLFPATAAPLGERRFVFVHVDVDIYQSVLDCCGYFYPRLAPGGVMVFDDYGMPTCPGAKLAVDTFFAETPEAPCYLPTGQAVVARL
jgi:O-methyltransferase